MANVIAGIALVAVLAGILILVNKVLKIPRGFITSCCGGGGIFSSEEYKKRKEREKSSPDAKNEFIENSNRT
jgi:Fe-S oxidoreductase